MKINIEKPPAPPREFTIHVNDREMRLITKAVNVFKFTEAKSFGFETDEVYAAGNALDNAVNR